MTASRRGRAIPWCASSAVFEARFERVRSAIGSVVDGARAAAAVRDLLPRIVRVSFLLVPYLGRNFFPSVDAGNI